MFLQWNFNRPKRESFRSGSLVNGKGAWLNNDAHWGDPGNVVVPQILSPICHRSSSRKSAKSSWLSNNRPSAGCGGWARWHARNRRCISTFSHSVEDDHKTGGYNGKEKPNYQRGLNCITKERSGWNQSWKMRRIIIKDGPYHLKTRQIMKNRSYE